MNRYTAVALNITTLVSLSFPLAASAQYLQTNLVANDAKYNPQIIDADLRDAWGVAIRPAGLGGHFWVANNASGTVTEYVGDVNGTPLFQDSLKTVSIPPQVGSSTGSSGAPTGTVFNASSEFQITQSHIKGAVSNASKFIFAGSDGVVSAWTERKNSDGTFDRPNDAIIVSDRSSLGDQYFGIAVTGLASGNHLYVANFGTETGIRTYDGDFKDVTSAYAFTNPFIADDFAPFNIQDLNGSLLVAFAKYDSPGTELHGSGLGKLAEFDYDGNLIAIWQDNGLLNSPWGLAIAPSDFGAYSSDLLVANFGDGSITAFDPLTKQALGRLLDPYGAPIEIDGIWGLTFGNGASLGAANQLYFTAGPNDEQDGLFGKLQAVPEPSSMALLGLATLCGSIAFLKRKNGKQECRPL